MFSKIQYARSSALYRWLRTDNVRIRALLASILYAQNRAKVLHIYVKLELFDCCAVDGDASAQASLIVDCLNEIQVAAFEF